MLEKIGLPSKPSLRGNNWVVDASHCQGCSSQFTFINRKHHCRRCGGLFCGSCTQQRLYLRGQGDAPVRICEPCKKLEEAARFEMRQGHKNRAGKGASKLASGKEDEVLNMIIGDGGNESVDLLSGMQQATSSRSSSNIQVTPPNAGEEIVKSLPDMESLTPEELRQKAIDEKKKYKILKAEGKREEALRAFKRGKELERQAGALETEMRKKNRQKTLSSITDNQIQNPKDKKDDLADELRELGWSDRDLRDADRKPVSMTVEGELSMLISEVSKKSDSTVKKTHGVDNSEVIALKKSALALKREGKLAEAKEELKRAKILEKQIEEQELLGDAEESDDELYSLIHSMDIDKQDILSTRDDDWNHVDFDHLLSMDDGLDVDGNFDVTDEDTDDPEITDALQSLGWAEDTRHPAEIDSVAVPVLDKEALYSEIRSLKKEAVNKKRAGNTAVAMALLKKAKLLEADIESSESQVNDLSSQKSQLADNYSSKQDSDYKAPPKSKLAIQRELLAVKKKALVLRREGKIYEAEQELSKGKALEQQLEEIENASKFKAKQVHVSNKHADDIIPATVDIGDDEEVTDQDMHDPSYLSLLSSLGWKEEDNNKAQSPPKEENVRASMQTTTDSSLDKVHSSIQTGRSRKSRGEIQKELLGLKRKSLALRRQGEVEEAEEVLKMAKVLEDQLAEMDAPKEQVTLTPEFEKPNQTGVPSHSFKNAGDEIEIQKSSPIERLGINKEVTHEKSEDGTASEKGSSANESKSLQQEILAHKRKAVSLKREGKLAEAKEELRMAKLLEKNLEENNTTSVPSTSSSNVNSTSIDVGKKEQNSVSPPKLSSRDRFKLQQESLGHKRQALKLRREGRTEEAEAEFELAKALESQLEELTTTHDSTKPSAEPADDVGIEDLLDPQLLSALREIGIESVSDISHSPEKTEPVRQVAPKNIENPNAERTQLEEQIKAEKLKAINLKRAGKQTEALDALRRSKLLEKKFNSLVS